MSDKSFQISIVTPNKTVFSGEGERFFAPSIEGYFEILKNHLPFLAVLKIGKIVITQGDEKIHFSVSGGFVEVYKNRVIVLAETSETVNEVDIERAQKSREKALKRIADKSPSIDIERAKASLLRALNRLSVAKMG